MGCLKRCSLTIIRYFLYNKFSCLQALFPLSPIPIKHEDAQNTGVAQFVPHVL